LPIVFVTSPIHSVWQR